MRLTIIMFVLAIVLGGCTGYSTYTRSNETFPTTDAKVVRVYATTPPAGEYVVVGYLSVYYSDAQDDGNLLKEKLKARASLIGANAIIAFKLNQAVSGGGGAEGIAVRFKQ